MQMSSRSAVKPKTLPNSAHNWSADCDDLMYTTVGPSQTASVSHDMQAHGGTWCHHRCGYKSNSWGTSGATCMLAHAERRLVFSSPCMQHVRDLYPAALQTVPCSCLWQHDNVGVAYYTMDCFHVLIALSEFLI